MDTADISPVHKKIRLDPFAALRGCPSADSMSEEQSDDFSPSEELENYKAMRVAPA